MRARRGAVAAFVENRLIQATHFLELLARQRKQISSPRKLIAERSIIR